MPNSLYNLLNNSNQNNTNSMISQFEQFAKTVQGDPQQMVQQLLMSGRMTQNQFNYLSQMANQFQNLLRKG